MQGFSRFSCLRTISIFVAEEMSGKTKFHTPARAIASPSHLPVQMRLSKCAVCPDTQHKCVACPKTVQTACPNSLPVQTLGLSKLWACPKAEKTTPTPEAGGNSVLSHKVLYRVCKNSLSSQQFGQAKPKAAEVNFGQANCLDRQTVWYWLGC